MLNRVTRCRGMKPQTFPYSPSTKELALMLIRELRPQFIEDCKQPARWQGEVLAGHWVNDDGHVMCMLQSSATANRMFVVITHLRCGWIRARDIAAPRHNAFSWGDRGFPHTRELEDRPSRCRRG